MARDINFTITGAELEAVEEFKIKHRASCTSKHNLTAGDYWSYIFIPTVLGVVKIVQCNLCGEENDVTDISNW
jgi:hypothetical protein